MLDIYIFLCKLHLTTVHASGVELKVAFKRRKLLRKTYIHRTKRRVDESGCRTAMTAEDRN